MPDATTTQADPIEPETTLALVEPPAPAPAADDPAPGVVQDGAGDVVHDPAPGVPAALEALDAAEADREEQLFREVLGKLVDALDELARRRPPSATPEARQGEATSIARAMLAHRGISGPDLERLADSIGRGACDILADEETQRQATPAPVPETPEAVDREFAGGLAQAQRAFQEGDESAVADFYRDQQPAYAERRRAAEEVAPVDPDPEPPSSAELAVAHRIGTENIAAALAALATADPEEGPAILARVERLRDVVAELEAQLPDRPAFATDAAPPVEVEPPRKVRFDHGTPPRAPSLVVPAAMLGVGMLLQAGAFALLAMQTRTDRKGG